MITITEIKPKVQKLAKDAPETQPLCWLEHMEHGEWIDAYYCPDCADAITGWLTGMSEKPPLALKHEDHPFEWIGSKPGGILIVNTRGDYEAEGAESCELCGCRLDTYLLISGVQSEIEHFEMYGITDRADWRDFYAILDGIDHVEAGWFPGEWMDAKEQDLHRDLYYRALALAEKHLPKIGKK
jgi:hypothetical protein